MITGPGCLETLSEGETTKEENIIRIGSELQASGDFNPVHDRKTSRGRDSTIDCKNLKLSIFERKEYERTPSEVEPPEFYGHGEMRIRKFFFKTTWKKCFVHVQRDHLFVYNCTCPTPEFITPLTNTELSFCDGIFRLCRKSSELITIRFTDDQLIEPFVQTVEKLQYLGRTQPEMFELEPEPKWLFGTELWDYVSTGDIVLFKSHGVSGKIIRGATGGRIDHLAIFVKLPNRTVGFIECVREYGVKLWSWSDFLEEKWYEQYDEVQLRRLHIPPKRRIAFCNQFLQFAMEVDGKDYSVKANKLVRKESSHHTAPERTFFCSELVGKALKVLGLLRKEVPSSFCYPAHFQSDRNMSLLQNCYFGREINIRFEEDT